MTLTKRKNGNGNGHSFPALTNDFLSNRFFGPGLLDFESDFWDSGIKMPPANISETSKEFKVDLSAPGLKRDDFKVELEEGTLVISCEKKEETNAEEENYRHREFSYSTFCRRFTLPENVVEDKINARYDNGMLHITIPKKETTNGKSKKAITVS